MTEQSPEPSAVQPHGPDAGEARANNLMGLALFAVFVLLFGGTVLVGLLYLAFD